MLDTETKRRIDAARDILVGKVPDPRSQVEQITIALIYKFMDDMDAQSVEMGGKATFFTGEFEKYGWRRVFDPRLGGFDILALYSEAITKINENPNVPQLFRDIFKNAFLPYRDPETLKLFLKTIDEFRYDHSERLGDAFEYLLSVLGSQGDAGQFRTPRHIIDFVVDIVDPQKGETILDPASGTAGFLISAYKHIVANNPDMTPDERKRLMTNVVGYDISPDMVRLGLANMYLHGFPTPEIHEYDTLTSEDRWNEYFDVILANPPFMSPKGGIKPHKKFAISAKRSEVLFVDYIAEHLTTKGRAGIIVPEGVIFQSQTAYKALRKMLVEQCLVAVVSLPAGVFNPYSGVKTSILILDRQLAKQSNSVGFFKVENDGFNLGAQRRPIEQNDLPQVFADISEYFDKLRTGQPADELRPQTGIIVPKEKLAANGDYNLSGERYRGVGEALSSFPIVTLGDVCEIYQPKTITQNDLKDDGAYVVFGANGVIGRYDQFNHEFAEVIITCRGATCGTVNYSTPKAWITGNAMVVTPKADSILKDFLFHILKHTDLSATISGSAQPQITRQNLAPFEIPLPPLEVQREIVAEIEGYQKVIDGARAVIDNYRPHIPINPTWPMVKLGDKSIFEVLSGGTPKSNVSEYWGGGIAWATLVDLPQDEFVTELYSTKRTITEKGLAESSATLVPAGSVIVSTRATIGRVAINRIPLATNQGFKNIVVKDSKRAVAKYVAFAVTNLVPAMQAIATGGTFTEISKSEVCRLSIPLPPLEEQERIVAEIEAEQRLVEANRELIERMEAKIAAVLDRIWGTDNQKIEQTSKTEASAAG